MRKFALIATGALAVGLAAPANAGPTSFELEVKTITGKAGTKKRPKPNGLTTTFSLSPAGNYATTRAKVYLDRRFKFNPRKFPTCSLQVIEASDGAECPPKSRVGRGDGQAETTATSPPTISPFTLQAFNGPQNRLYILLITEVPTRISGVLRGTLKDSDDTSGLFGKMLDVTIPDDLVYPFGEESGVTPTLTRFELTVQAKRGKRRYVQTTGCNRGKWNFKAELTFTDGEVKEDSDSVNCSR